MDLYIEIKPCHLSTMIMNSEGFWDALIDCYGIKHFKNGICNLFEGTLWLTPDYKYAYGHCNGRQEYFRVHNISSKPIKKKQNKVKEWYKITNEINKLKEKRKRLSEKLTGDDEL